MVTLGVQAVASARGERGSGYAADGGRTAIDYFDTHSPEELATDAARIAATNLVAEPAPAGEMEMVVGAGGGGVLLHEAVGHGLESDFNRRGTSLYSGRIGERVASDLVTIYDDGNLPEERGSIAVVFEGNTHVENLRQIFDRTLAAPAGKEVDIAKLAADRIHGPGRSDADSAEFSPSLRRALAQQAGDEFDALVVTLGISGSLRPGKHFAAIIDNADRDFCSADIDRADHFRVSVALQLRSLNSGTMSCAGELLRRLAGAKAILIKIALTRR